MTKSQPLPKGTGKGNRSDDKHPATGKRGQEERDSAGVRVSKIHSPKQK